MKKLIIIPLLFFCLLSFSQSTWYVSPTGDDSNDGTATDDGHAWKTWGKAFNSTDVDPGDTVYFRGGTYMKAWGEGDYYHADGKSYRIDRGGTAGNYVHYFAYPGEVPILDSDDIVPNTNLNYAIRGGADYTWFKGLTIRNVWSVEGGIGGSSVEAFGWKANGNHLIIDNCKFYNTHGIGLQLAGSNETILVRNCDAWNHCDSFAISPQLPGNRGSGFTVLVNPTSMTAYYTFAHCRAWDCGDQGFSGGWIGHTRFDGCWAFNNGQLQGEGHGYKLGWAIVNGTVHDVFNCIAAYNRCDGFRTNDNGRAYIRGLNIYNNIAYKNGILDNYYGFVIYNTTASDVLELTRVFKNNISYDNDYGDLLVTSGASYTHSNNTWDIPITVAGSDFLDLPADNAAGITLLSGARQEDGSLLDLGDYFHLDDAQLNGQGENVGLTYDGDSLYHNIPPDLGPFAYNAGVPAPPEYPQVTTTVTVIGSVRVTATGTDIDDGGGEVSAKGICWDTSTNPTTSDNIVPAGSGTDDFSCTLIVPSNTTIYISAYVTNETATTYGAVISVTTPETSPVLDDSGNILLDDSDNIIIE